MTEIYNVQYSLESLSDLKEIYSYISSELLSPDIAVKQVDRLRNAIRKLDSLPNRHPLVEWEPWHSMDIHLLPVDNFNVYYLVEPSKMLVSVVRIFYSGRDIENIINN